MNQLGQTSPDDLHDADETVPNAKTVVTHEEISGFWRRLFSFFIDSMLLGAIGLAIGIPLYDFFSRLGPRGVLVGFSIALVYFVTLNSSLGKGQTLGKRLMRIRVVDKNGEYISPARSFVRYVVLAVPFFLNGAMLPPSVAASSLWVMLIGFIVFGGGLAIIYLYVFNRRTRQSLHDLAVGTYVISTPAPENPQFERIGKGHLAVVGAMAVLVLVGIIALKDLSETPFFKELLALQMKIQVTGRVHTSTVMSGSSTTLSLASDENEEHSSSVKYLTIEAICKEPAEDAEDLAKDIAEIVVTSYPRIRENDIVNVRITRGYDIGIARLWETDNFKYRPDELANKLEQSL